jgi:CRISPR-associated endonuclease Csn1
VDISESLTLGIDLGIGSCGWAIIEATDQGQKLLALGARTFDVPETDKERTPTNQLRRQHRGLRRVISRKRQRMNAIRDLFAEAGLLPSADKHGLAAQPSDPWALRAAGLDRLLKGPELAIALGHIAKHRGFQSNSKRDRGSNAPKEQSDMLKAIAATVERLAGWRSVGEMFFKDPEFAQRKRNRDGDYSRSILRNDLRHEVRLLFSRQRQLGNTVATELLEEQFEELAFYQRPLGDSESKVGPCPFEPGEKRAAKYSYSFELFRLLARLTSLRIRQGRTVRALTADEISLVTNDFGSQQSLSFSRLRKILELSTDDRFEGVALHDEKGRDAITRSGAMAPGSYTLKEKILGEAGWRVLKARPDTLDAIGFICSFREDAASIQAGLEALGLEPEIFNKLMQGVADGSFAKFSGAGHISAKACRALIPHLAQGMVYSDACTAAGYDHAKRVEVPIEGIANPIARKSLSQAMKQVKTIIETYGLPGKIHVELARDVGKGIEERREIEAGIEKRNKQKDWLRKQFLEIVGQPSNSAEDLLRFELWHEQDARCIYTDELISPNWLVSSDNRVQVDHILPWSRSGDGSFRNKTLCLAIANQKKKGRTPFEWFKDDGLDWEKFTARVETNKAMKGFKKRNFLLKDASVLEEKFRSRNLNDTRYACRLLLNSLKTFYPKDGHEHVFARPGALTDRLRRGWGIQGLKKIDGKRVDDDRHHALDAAIVAATDNRTLQKLIRAAQEAEAKGLARDFGYLEPPWPTFRDELLAKYENVFVSRAERRRARGEAHAATIRQIGEDDDGKAVVYERKSIEKLTEGDLAKIKDPDRNVAVVNALRNWIAAGKPKDALPKSPKGDVINKVRIKTKDKVNVLVRDGSADRGEMTRVDVFRKLNKRGKVEYFLVPIYPHQIADKQDFPVPPNRAVQAYQDEADWPEIGEEHEFLWSLYPLSYVEVTKPDGQIIEGYFRQLDRSTGAVSLSPHHSSQTLIRSIGVRTLLNFRKFSVDRLGNCFEIHREQRTWHGVVCT